jgi:hypothetical protein
MTSRGKEPQEMVIFPAKAPFRRRLMFSPTSKHGHPGSRLNLLTHLHEEKYQKTPFTYIRFSYAPLPRFLFSLSNHIINDE